MSAIVITRDFRPLSDGDQRAKSKEWHDQWPRAKNVLDLSEMDKLLEPAEMGGHGARDHLLLLMIYRHGLRVSAKRPWAAGPHA